MHDLSPRAAGPFVAVNCAAIVETLLEAELFGIEDRTATGVKGRRGKFESADAGTLFLDEVSDLSLAAQAKLLRAIQEVAVERVGGNGARRVDIRIIVATNRPLVDLVAQGLFRADRMPPPFGGVEIHVPALRERREDIPELANYYLSRHRQTRDLLLSAPALEALRAYDWPGNVRELERLIESAVALTESESIELDDLPPRVRGEYAEVLGKLDDRRALRCVPGAAATRGSCSNAAGATSGGPAGCSISATTRCRRTCVTQRCPRADPTSSCPRGSSQ